MPRARVKRIFDITCEEEADPHLCGTINLVYLTSQKMRMLNRKFRGLDRATDVLSFNIDESPGDNEVFGEVYIAVPRAAVQARRYRASLSEELERLFCHGLLHLFGHDHQTKRETARMESAERTVYTRLNGGER